jgi:hypothetical protein
MVESKTENCEIEKEVKIYLKSQWQIVDKSLKFVLYRWIFAGFFLFAITMSLLDYYDKEDIRHWLLYETNWGLVIGLYAGINSAVLVTLDYFGKLNTIEMSRKNLNILWWCTSVSVPLALQITTVFWFGYFYLNFDRELKSKKLIL